MTFLFVPFAALKQTTSMVGPGLGVFLDGLSCTVPSRRRMDCFFCCPFVGRIFFVSVATFSHALKAALKLSEGSCAINRFQIRGHMYVCNGCIIAFGCGGPLVSHPICSDTQRLHYVHAYPMRARRIYLDHPIIRCLMTIHQLGFLFFCG